VNNDFGRMWREAVMAYFEVLYQHLPGGTKKSHEKSVKIADLRAKN
jgi:hypothetical protein